MKQFELLFDLLQKHGPSGDEGNIAQFIIEYATPFCDDISVDPMGNVIAHQKGNGKKIMLSAHLDSTGFVVTHIEDSGFLRVGRLGGIDPRDMLNATVEFKNGVKGVLVKEEKTAVGKVTINDVVIDIGARNKEEAEQKVLLGDTAVVSVAPFLMNMPNLSLVAPYLDNRISCYILLEAMKETHETPVENDLYYVFSAQEEVGVRGAKTAAFTVDPEYGIAVDVTDVNDNVGTDKNGTCKLGDGAGIKIMDRSVICHPEVIETLEGLATKKELKHQRDILKMGGTDAGAIHLSRGGVKTGGISVPCRNIHTPAEMVCMSDVAACISLTVAFVGAKL